jgi:hypothetical protein
MYKTDISIASLCGSADRFQEAQRVEFVSVKTKLPFGTQFGAFVTNEIPCNGYLLQDHKKSRGMHSAGVRATIEEEDG